MARLLLWPCSDLGSGCSDKHQGKTTCRNCYIHLTANLRRGHPMQPYLPGPTPLPL
jgi:hypothetical protein